MQNIPATLRVAYLVNQYPKVSHTFIRREILALEALGVTVDRFALRGWDGDAVDPVDLQERDKTAYTLKNGIVALMMGLGRRFLRQPGTVWQGVRAAMAMARGGMRPWPYHLVYLAHASWILDRLERQPVAHLHAHFGTNPAEIANLVHVMGGPTYSFTVHGMDEADNAPRLAFDTKIEAAGFAVAISAYTRSQLMRHLPPDLWPRIKVVHCGLPESAFSAPGTEETGPDTPVFLCVGRLSGEKGHLVLLDAFAQVRAHHPDALLVLAGDGDLRAVIEARINALDLRDAVRITGWIGSDQVMRELQNCHVLVQPSFIEGLPVVIMEAMAQRRAVISTFVAGIPELVIPDENGWLVPAGTIEELAQAMENSITLPQTKMRAMRNAAFDRVRARHSILTEAGRLKALFLGQG
ncbi:glycosyltransferase family 4 protein [Seohaeicola saemankumensis]|uniref:Glycosyltransferase family 4 protein n=1 Tax=Seohaeicola saemankumensis TaxID=481181 RepID=A0ABW3TED8_9RHOB